MCDTFITCSFFFFFFFFFFFQFMTNVSIQTIRLTVLSGEENSKTIKQRCYGLTASCIKEKI